MVDLASYFIFTVRTDPRVKAVLMGEMMAMAAAETMEFGVAEEELLSLHPDVAASEFNRQEHAHFEEYVGGLTAETRKFINGCYSLLLVEAC